MISMQALNLLEQTCDLLINYSKLSKGIGSELDQYGIDRGSLPVLQFSTFNKVLQKEFDIIKRTCILIYGHKYEPLSIFQNGESTLNPRVIRRLKEFGAFKNFVANQADQSSGLVDLLELKSFIDEIDLRYNIIKNNMEKGEIVLSGGITM
jgi:hypothetical protein